MENENLFFQNLIESINKEQEISTNPNYILWLEKFTETYPNFFDDDFLSGKKAVSLEDMDGIDSLSSFYHVIERYADNNYIYEDKESMYSGSYKIKYHNIGYEIGYLTGQGTVFFCNRVDNPDDTYIDFNDILTNKNQPNTERINQLLEELSIIVDSFYEQGIPLPALKKKLNQIISSLNKQTNEREKILVKRYE